MRAQKRNAVPVWYALYNTSYKQTNAEGKRTGENVQDYADPVCVKMNVSAAKGAADVEMFGIDTPYTKTLTTCDMSCPIAEDSVLWIDAEPDDKTPYNYVVVRIARSLNSITYAVKEVDVK